MKENKYKKIFIVHNRWHEDKMIKFVSSLKVYKGAKLVETAMAAKMAFTWLGME